MERMYEKNQVVQFNEEHKWCGSLGIITEVKELNDGNIRIMVGVPMPQQGTAYVYCYPNEIEYIGYAVLILAENEEEN